MTNLSALREKLKYLRGQQNTWGLSYEHGDTVLDAMDIAIEALEFCSAQKVSFYGPTGQFVSQDKETLESNHACMALEQIASKLESL